MILFDDISNEAKVWVYVSKTIFNANQKKIISKLSLSFLSDWKSHGEQVKGSVNVIENCFLLISAEVTSDTMCGRAVDSNVRFVKEIEKQTELNLLDRMTVAYRTKDDSINITSFSTLKSQIENNNDLDLKSVFNPMVSTKKEFLSSFEEPFEKSWIA
jgi:hypothetical protein